MSGPPVELARGDRVGGFHVTSILGWGVEGVTAQVVDEFLALKRVLKAYPHRGCGQDAGHHSHLP